MRIKFFFILTLIFIIYINYKGVHHLNDSKEFVFFAHRGAKYLPENSDVSFKECRDLGFSALETDINITKDNKLIVFHDDYATRLLGVDKKINNCYWSEIKQKNIIYNGKKSDSNILLLEDLLENKYNFELVYLDIKASVNKNIADELLKQLEKFNSFDKFLIADANILFLSYLKYKNPEVQTVLEGFKKGYEWSYFLIPISFRPNYYSSFYKDINSNHVEFLKKNNLINNKIIYGIDDFEISKAKSLGLKKFIVNLNGIEDTSLKK